MINVRSFSSTAAIMQLIQGQSTCEIDWVRCAAAVVDAGQ